MMKKSPFVIKEESRTNGIGIYERATEPDELGYTHDKLIAIVNNVEYFETIHLALLETLGYPEYEDKELKYFYEDIYGNIYDTDLRLVASL